MKNCRGCKYLCNRIDRRENVFMRGCDHWFWKKENPLIVRKIGYFSESNPIIKSPTWCPGKEKE
jgi:hypothetical protein